MQIEDFRFYYVCYGGDEKGVSKRGSPPQSYCAILQPTGRHRLAVTRLGTEPHKHHLISPAVAGENDSNVCCLPDDPFPASSVG